MYILGSGPGLQDCSPDCDPDSNSPTGTGAGTGPADPAAAGFDKQDFLMFTWPINYREREMNKNTSRKMHTLWKHRVGKFSKSDAPRCQIL